MTTISTLAPAPVAADWLAADLAALAADPTAADFEIHLLHAPAVSRWRLWVLDLCIRALGFSAD
jgi:hypothetical protein